MTRPNPESLRSAIQALTTRLAQRPGWPAEEARGRRSFHGDRGPSAAGSAQDLAEAEARCTEWLLFERSSEVLGDVPIRVLLDVATGDDDLQESLANSLVGAFLVRSGEGEVAQAFDVQTEDPLEIRTAKDSSRPGDLLVGRLFPDANGVYWPSPNIALHRGGAGLAQALHGDLQSNSPGDRLSQADLERVMFQQLFQAVQDAGDAIPLEHLEADLQQLLVAGGVDDVAHVVTEASQAIRSSEHPSSVIGPLLDQWAFSSAVDLEGARGILWQMVAAPGAPRPGRFTQQGSGSPKRSGSVTPAGGEDEDHVPGLGAAAAARLQEGAAAGEDLEELFKDVARLVGMDPAELDPESNPAEEAVADLRVDPEAISGAVEGEGGKLSDPGDLEPLVEEYLWELDQGLATRPDSFPPEEPGATLRQMVEIQKQHPVPRTTLDRLDAEDLSRLYLHRYLHGKPDRAYAVRIAHEVVGSFLEWTASTQEIDRRAAWREASTELVEPAERLAALGSALSDDGDEAGAQPSVVRVDGPGDGVLRVTVEQVGEVELVVTPDAQELARPADVLLGGLKPVSGGRSQMVGEVVAVTQAIERLLG